MCVPYNGRENPRRRSQPADLARGSNDHLCLGKKSRLRENGDRAQPAHHASRAPSNQAVGPQHYLVNDWRPMASKGLRPSHVT